MRKFIFSLLITISLIGINFAQSNTGNLVVNVSDPSGVIPGATIVITDNQSGKERTVVAGDEGSVSVPQLEVGTYTVKVTSPGRKTGVYNDVKIDIGQTYTLSAGLEAGDIQEVVEITAGADVINSANAELSNTVSSRQIQELPLNGRNPLALITLQPGTASNGATNTVINGQRSSFTNITRDGLNIQDNFIRANATDFVPDRANVDDVGEFTITTQNAGVEAGYGSSQVQLVTPRGSNDFHGAAYIYNRNSKFTSNSFFNNFNNIKRPFLNRNQFGGKLGGPIINPGFGEDTPFFQPLRDKAFFYVAYEGFRLRQSTSTTRTVLTSNARTGVFTYLDNAGTLRTINLFAIAPAGSVTAIDPVVASRILANVPAGNSIAVGDQRNTTGYVFNQLQNQDREAIKTRFDIDANSKNSISAIFGYNKEFLLRPDVDNGGFNATPFGFQDAQTYTINTAWRYTPTASLTNEVRGAVQLSYPAFDQTAQSSNFFLTLPLISSPESTFQTQGRDTKTWTLQDNAVYTWGNHSFRFGAQANWFRINPFGPPAFSASTIPNITISTATSTPSLSATLFPGGISSTQLGAANSLFALLGGIVSSASQTFNVVDQTGGFQPNTLPNRNLHYENYSVYGGDQWRVNQSLTLNFGLRYEFFTPIREPNGLALEPVIGANQDVRAAILDPNGTYNFVGTNNGNNQFFGADKNNFDPNISFAWTPNFGKGFLGNVFPNEGRTVIRGGFSINHVNDEFVRAADNALNGNQGLSQGRTVTGLNQRLSTFSNPIVAPTFQVPRTYAQNNALAGNFGTVFAIDPQLQVPSLYQWNIGIQRELGWKTAIEVRYVGNRSNNLVRGLDLNQVNITSNGFLADFNRAASNLQLSTAFRSAETARCTALPTAAERTACLNALNSSYPLSAAYDSRIVGSQVLTVFPTLGSGGLLTNATIQGLITGGTPADLATTYISNSFANASKLFLANPNTGVVDLLGNYAKSRYNSLQVELRRRFSDGLYFQANYTFQKTLTDAAGIGQTRFDPLIDNANPENEYARWDADAQHVFNFNGIYELPIGKGRRFLNQGGIVDFILGGWQMTSIVQVASGAPITITDPRGTLNRAGRSGRQTANSNLTNEEIAGLIGIYRTPCGIFWINPEAINLNQTALQNGQCSSLAANGANPAYFSRVAPGQTGNMSRNVWNGPLYLNWDASLMKNFRITENVRFQVRGEVFNVLNRANFFVGIFPGSGNINSANFGRVTSTFSPRIVQFAGRLEF